MNVNLIHVLSRAGEAWTGETGCLDQDRIEKYCGRFLNGKPFYVCGSPKVVAGDVRTLWRM
ncbi:MAG: hypothetical protein WAL98_17740 [Desulfatiglandaceae bacterium]